MKKLAIKIAFLSLLLFISVPIFKMQVNIHKLDEKKAELQKQSEYAADKLENAKEKLERIQSGDEEVLKEIARDSIGLYDPAEEIILNDITD